MHGMRVGRYAIALALCIWAGAAFAEGRVAGTMSPVVSALDTLDPNAAPAPEGLQWRILKPEWSASDERAYGEFVRAIGLSECRSVDECLKSPANIYRASDPAGLSFFADCADLPYVLRAYFAWKNGLPFSYVSGVAAIGESNDLRYSRYGNYVFQRTDVLTPSDGRWPNASYVLTNIANQISSAMYRFAPKPQQGDLFDFYPVRISPAAIRPGTNIYDPNGHVAVVYDVDGEGRIRFIDSHPDNSLTRGSYGHRFVRASPPMGAGFKNWRPLKLVGASRAGDGSYVGGYIVAATDGQLPSWSDEQFYGTARGSGWQSGRFVYKGETLDYYDYVRRAVAGHDVIYDPLAETRSMVRGLCDDLHYRAMAIDIAVQAGLDAQPQPVRLPDNIYGTSGDWETYSTPSRDARLKVSFQELKDQVAKFLALHKARSAHVAYRGTNLARDLATAYREEAGACAVVWTASDGSKRQMSFEEARRRLFDFSFDPYQCPERRWGAQGAELATCRDGDVKRRWYEAERRLRNQTERTYDVKMGFSLEELRADVPGSGQDAPPDVDVLSMLGRAADEKSASAMDALKP
ncbi:hypothetical protein [Parvibaculum sp.]|uniref:hypothetical protein n=1 Tax=Parvibaculum sp. TaxID=2024848 RepID=UPI0032106B01